MEGELRDGVEIIVFGFYVVPSTLTWAGGAGHSSR